jgi:DNA-binding protein YbaB
MGGGTPGDPEEIRYELRRAANHADELHEQFTRARERIDTLTATAHSTDGAVTVTVRAGGELVGLELGDLSTRLRPADLAARILDCVRRAQAAIPGEVHGILADTVPGGDPVAEALRGDLLADLREKFPAQPPVRMLDARPKQLRIGVLEDLA